MRAPTAIVAILLVGTAAAVASAQEPAQGSAPAAEPPPAPDLSAWTCRFCTFEDGWKGWLEPGIGQVSDPSFRFGDYTGLEQSGGFMDLGGAWSYRAAGSAEAWDVRAQHLGLDSRTLGVRGGRQGRYRLSLDYESLPHLLARDASTPFAGASALGLPAGWNRGGSTGGMSALDASLRRLELRQERERIALGLALTPHRAADLRVAYHRDETHGTGALGGSFMTLASELPRPIDQTHDRIDASVAFTHALGQAQLALASSFFSNGARALTWENPYSGPTSGATAGQMALAPDNEAHRLSLTLGSPPGAPLQLSGQLALGRMEQNQRFLPATVNPDEAVALPRNSLDGRVDTTLAALRAGWSVGGSYRIGADLLHDERDSRTPVAAYTQVVMDTFTGDVRTNAPYGFTRDRWRLSVERRSKPRLALGVDDDTRERRLFGVGETQERKYWGRLGWRPFDGADLRLRIAHAQREGTEFAGGAGVPAQNALLRAYNTAERRRNEARGDFSLGGGLLTNSFNVTYARDEYPDTVVGRTSGRELGYGSDVMLQPTETLAISAYASHRRQQAGQAGSQTFGLPDWAADQEDATNVIGVSTKWQAPRGIDLGADYVLSTSAGSITMLAGGSESGFPLLLTRWHDARLFARYPLRPNLSLRLDLVREVYTARDWALDGLDPGTVPNLLALGQGSQSGAVTAVLLGVRYEFATAAPAAD